MHFLWRHKLVLTIFVLVIFASWQIALQIQEDNRLSQIAESVVSQKGATTRYEKACALRDFLRMTVSYQQAAHDGRPFLRATALETLNSGKGYCGEVTRSFIGLARMVDIPAQRINLYGKVNHVVAIADLGDGKPTLIDCQNPAHIHDLQTLDKTLLQPEFSDYSTLNFRRIGIGWLVPRLKLDIGWLSYLTENPHAIKAAGALAFVLLLLAISGLRVLTRRFLGWRGWVHSSNNAAISKIVVRQKINS
jgi:hypothetical protein